MANSLQSTSGDIEEIVEIRKYTNNEQSRGNRTIHTNCELESEPQTRLCVSQSDSQYAVETAIDMVTTKDSSLNSNKDKKAKNKHRIPPPPGIKDDLTVIAHFCLGIYVAIICYLCFSNPFTFFTWHPLLLTIGWALLTTEAVLFISKENPVVQLLGLNRTWKLRYHWILLTIAIAFIGTGFVVVFINKNYLHKEHFKTWHGFFGLLSLIGFTPATINGIAALYDVNLKNYIKPNVIKTIHQASGTAAFIFGGVTLVLSVYTNWFTKNSGGNKYIFLSAFIMVLYSFLWTLQRPFVKCLRKIFNVPF